MKVKTHELQELVTKVAKGASNNKLLPLTSLVEIAVGNNVMLLTTTDATNYFTVRMDNVDSDPFRLSVNVDMFTKLVQKITSEYISIEAMDNYLMVIGNGKYKIDLLMDETGKPVTFPRLDGGEAKEEGTISVASIKKILTNNKASLSVDSSVPCLTNYYCGEKVITTDRYKICQTDVELFKSTQLISPIIMELLSTFKEDSISYTISDTVVEFDSPNEYLYAPIVSGVEKMPIDAINSLLNNDVADYCILSKDALLSVLDRLSIFVSPYDKNTIYLTFGDDGLSIESKKSNGAEKIVYLERNGNNYTCAIDIEMLHSQVNTIPTANIKMYYNSTVSVKFVNEDAIRIIALQEDDRYKGE